jgi:hypothetical protein
LGNPKVSIPDNSLDGKALLIRLKHAARLYVFSPENALARLWVLQYGIFLIDAMFSFEVAGIGSRPMLIQRRACLPIIHFTRAFGSQRDKPRSSESRTAIPFCCAAPIARLLEAAVLG